MNCVIRNLHNIKQKYKTSLNILVMDTNTKKNYLT